MNSYVLGLDIGITSVGYGVIDLKTNNFVDYGVRLFKEGTAAENEARRSARGRRRLLSRRKNRLEDMRNLLKKYQIIDENFKPLSNVYELRNKGLSTSLTNDELASALLHLTKHRGSVLDTVEDDEEAAKDSEKTKAVLGTNAKLLAQGRYVCQLQLERLQSEGKVRGHANNFKTTDYIEEANEILKHQNIDEKLKEKIIEIIQRKRAYYEGPGSEKSPTPYGRFIEVDGQIQQIDLIEKMRGKCSVYPNESRAPKMSLSAELFNFLNDLNNLTVDGEKLTTEEKNQILKVVSQKGSITLKQVAKLLEVEEDSFAGYRIDKSNKPLLTEFKGYKKVKKIFKECGEDISFHDYEKIDFIIEIITKQKGMQERKTSLENSKYTFTNTLLDKLVLMNGVSGYHALSFKALRELNKELYMTDMNQMQILHQMNLFDKNRISHKGRNNIMADETAILSPVARRAQNETFKVINELRKKYGEFDSIVIEMTRDKNSVEQAKKQRESQRYFEGLNKEVNRILEEYGYDADKVNGKTKTKLRLYMEQDGKSAYTLQPLDIRRIISDPTYTEIDHVIPVSISLDDSLNNKVLITRMENQLKGQMTPIEAYQKGKFAGSGCTLTEYIENVKNNKKYSNKKRGNLLFKEDITKFSVIQQFINRNLVDTSYACLVVLNTLSDYFKDNGIDTKVHTVVGKLTNKLRQQIQLEKIRDEDYLHHAVDALIVASIKKMGLLNSYLMKYTFDKLYDEMTGEVKEVPEDKAFFDEKYISFIVNLKTLYMQSNQYYRGILERKEMVYAPIKISHKINTKPNRQVADETIYSTRNIDNKEMIVQKYKDIYEPKFDKLTNDTLSGVTEQKYLMARNDPQTFDILKQIVMHHFDEFKDSKEHYKKEVKKGVVTYKLVGDNPLYLYKEEFGPVRKSSKKGNGPVITSMKYVDRQLGSHIDISKNYDVKNKKVILKQVSPYRTDIYLCSDGKYRFVTVRYKDVFYKKEKQKYVIDANWYVEEKKRKKIDENANFICSLHRDELIGIVRKAGEKYIYDESTEHGGEVKYHDGIHPEILKFTATNDDERGYIELKPIFTYCKKQLKPAILNCVEVSKYATDVLGNLYKVKQNILKLEFE